MAFEQIKKFIGAYSSKSEVDENAQPVDDVDVKEQIWREELISFVKDEFARRQMERAPFELQWRLNMNFINNHQYCSINTYANSIEEQNKDWYWQEREVFNHIAPIVETRLSKLSRVKPSMTVLPATSNLDDVAATKVGRSILKANYKKLRMEAKIDTANSWAEICGCVFHKNTWNTHDGKLIGFLKDEEGVQFPVHEGEVGLYVAPAYEVFPDNNYNDGPEHCRSIIHAKAFSVEEIKETWNVTVDGSDVDVYSLGMSQVSLGGLGYSSTVPIVAPTVKKNAATVMEYQELPSKNYPNGRLIIVAGNELLHYGPLPYENGEDKKRTFSLVRQNCIDRPGCFWGSTIVERCIPIQRSYNAVKNRKHEFLNRCALGVWTYEDGTLANEEELEEDGFAPGTMLPRKQGSAPPTQINNGNLPPEFSQEEAQLEQQFINISGISELSRNSAAPTGVGSGTALEILNQQDDTRINLTAQNVKLALVEIAKHQLRLYKQFAKVPRMERLVGENNEILIEMWTANDITSDDVVPETEDNLSQTPAQKKQMVINVMNMGLLQDPDTGRISRRMRSKALEALDMGNWESIDDVEQLQINRAMKENGKIGKDEPIKVRPYDDHEMHLIEHNRFRLSDDYDTLAKERPDLVFIFDAHCDQHSQILQEKQNAMMQQQLALAGKGGGSAPSGGGPAAAEAQKSQQTQAKQIANQTKNVN